MRFGAKIGVVLPAYNEEQLVADTVNSVPSFVDEICVVDDASCDGTGDRVAAISRAGLKLVTHKENQGVGGAIITGYRHLQAHGCDVIVVMGADNQMDPADMEKLIAPVAHGVADYVKGDRLSVSGVFKAMPFWRFVGNHVLTIATRLCAGYREVRDSQCGYTALAAHMIDRIDWPRVYPRYGFPNSLLAHLHLAGARLAQVPVRPIYGAEVSGISLFTALVRVPLVLLGALYYRKIGFRGPSRQPHRNAERVP